MTYNLYRTFRGVVNSAPVMAGIVIAADAGGTQVKVELPDGGILVAIGSEMLGQRVYVRDGIVQGIAPDLGIVEITI